VLVSLVLSADVNILVFVPSTILSIEKASPFLFVGSYVDLSISQVPAQSAPLSAKTSQSTAVGDGVSVVLADVHMYDLQP
jgi:hypothetical protein